MAQWTPASQVLEFAAVATPPAPAVPVAVNVLPYSTRQIEELIFTSRALEMLRQTRPWARFIAVLIFIGAAFMLIGGIVFTVGVMTAGPGFRGGPPAFFGVICVVLAGLYIMPAIYLKRYASRITDLINLNRADMLEAALEAQKSFWKFVGIVAAITIALYIVGILVAVLFATVWR